MTGNHSLFSISDPDVDPSFVPVFFDSVNELFGNNTELKQKAEAACGSSNFQCLFDYTLTADSQAVAESQSSLQEFETEERILRMLHNLHSLIIFILCTYVNTHRHTHTHTHTRTHTHTTNPHIQPN